MAPSVLAFRSNRLLTVSPGSEGLSAEVGFRACVGVPLSDFMSLIFSRPVHVAVAALGQRKGAPPVFVPLEARPSALEENRPGARRSAGGRFGSSVKPASCDAVWPFPSGELPAIARIEEVRFGCTERHSSRPRHAPASGIFRLPANVAGSGVLAVHQWNGAAKAASKGDSGRAGGILRILADSRGRRRHGARRRRKFPLAFRLAFG